MAEQTTRQLVTEHSESYAIRGAAVRAARQARAMVNTQVESLRHNGQAAYQARAQRNIAELEPVAVQAEAALELARARYDAAHTALAAHLGVEIPSGIGSHQALQDLAASTC